VLQRDPKRSAISLELSVTRIKEFQNIAFRKRVFVSSF